VEVVIQSGRKLNSPVETLKPESNKTNSEGSGMTIDSIAMKSPAPKIPRLSTNLIAKSSTEQG
jgi:hypothetical protein